MGRRVEAGLKGVVAVPELLFQARQAQSVTYNPTPIVMMRLLSRLENRALAGDDISTTCLRTRRRPFPMIEVIHLALAAARPSLLRGGYPAGLERKQG